MPCQQCEDGKWRLNDGPCEFDSLEACQATNPEEEEVHHENDEPRAEGVLETAGRLYSGMSVSHPRLADRVFNKPLCIDRSKLEAVVNALHQHMGNLTAPDLRAEIMRGRRDERGFVEFPGGVAVIPVHGTLVHRSGWLDAWSGMTSYQLVEQMYFAAIEDSMISNVVLDLDTNGGETAGLFDTVDRMFDARGEKRVTAISNEAAFSAGYAIASVAHEIIVPRTAGVGSIGVIALHVDRSKAEAQAGIKVTEIFAGDKKADLSPHKPLSDRGHGDIQAAVDETYDIFVETVARNRGMKTKAVIDTQAGFFIGKSATNAGLADSIGAFNDALSNIVDSTKRGSTMSQATKAESAAATPKAETPAAPEVVETEAAKTSPINADQVKQEALAEERTRVAAIHKMCADIQRPELAAGLIEAGHSVERSKANLFDGMAVSDAEIDGTHTGDDKPDAEQLGASWDAAFGKCETPYVNAG